MSLDGSEDLARCKKTFGEISVVVFVEDILIIRNSV